jgi:hypothetical protein
VFAIVWAALSHPAREKMKNIAGNLTDGSYDEMKVAMKQAR